MRFIVSLTLFLLFLSILCVNVCAQNAYKLTEEEISSGIANYGSKFMNDHYIQGYNLEWYTDPNSLKCNEDGSYTIEAYCSAISKDGNKVLVWEGTLKIWYEPSDNLIYTSAISGTLDSGKYENWTLQEWKDVTSGNTSGSNNSSYDIGGSWSCLTCGDSHTIQQTGNKLFFKNTVNGATFEGTFTDATHFNSSFGPSGSITDNGNTINWSHGHVWKRN